MRRVHLGAALLIVSGTSGACGGSIGAVPTAVAPSESADPREVHVAADASVGELLAALRRSLEARGHVEGECFLAWDAGSTEAARIDVRVGERTRSAALSCGGLQDIASELQGRCVFARVFWVTPGEMRTHGLTYYFAEPGLAYAGAAVGGGAITAPAAEAVFVGAPPGARLVLGVPLDVPSADGGAAKQAEGHPEGSEGEQESVLDDPEVRRGLQQAVARAQRCNPGGAGSLVLEWRVLPDGTIEDVRPLTSTVSDEAQRCAVELFMASSFPEHTRSGAIEYCAPVLLDPALRGE